MAEAARGTLRVRGAELGAGRPTIIVPLTGTDGEQVLAQADAALGAPAPIIEWRADLLGPQRDADAHRRAALDLLPQLRERLGPDRALLLTVRTAAEGGGRTLDGAQLAELLVSALALSDDSGAPLLDLVDVETSREPSAVARVIAAAHARGVAVVGSWHDFTATPAQAEIAARLREQRALGADLPKVAVTPRTPQDVLALLGASSEVAGDAAGPHLAISMGPLGAVSRVAAEAFGSSATFASAGETSAPGQLEAADVARMLELLRP